jgi:hypothetical protein
VDAAVGANEAAYNEKYRMAREVPASDDFSQLLGRALRVI